METPSSTSNSERRLWGGSRRQWPWGALCALVILLLVDRTLYRSPEVWRLFNEAITSPSLLEQGLIQDRIALLELDRQPEGSAAPRVILVGSSRLNRGFHSGSGLEDPLAGIEIAKLAHPQLFPFEMRGATSAIVASKPDVVVLALSELETHSRIKLVPGSSFGDVAAIRDLVREAGLGFAIEHRVMLYRIALGQILNTYHYRGVMRELGFGRFRSFPHEGRLKSGPETERSATFLAAEKIGFTTPELKRIVAELDSRFPGRGSIVRKAQFGIVRSITRGEHAEINLALLRRTIEALREEGIAVVIVEPPIHPGAGVLYDTSIRGDFLDFARGLAREEGVRFVPLEAGPGYVEEDFGDLTHLEKSGVIKFTGVITEVILEATGGIRREPSPAGWQGLRE